MTRILVTNDDGVFSAGLEALTTALGAVAEVIVVAPDREQSATGHALTLSRPLRMQRLRENWYSVDGTPTDCVNLGVLSVLKDRPPNFVCSGINTGLNLGDDVTYSGTVSATFEGTLLGIPSLAFSQEIAEGFTFEGAARFARQLVETLLAGGEAIPGDLLLNVNVPAEAILGVSLTRLGRRVYKQSVIEKLDPRGRKYYWIAGVPRWQSDSGTDHAAVSAGLVSITPLHLDLTHYPGLETLVPLAEKLAGLGFGERREDAGGAGRAGGAGGEGGEGGAGSEGGAGGEGGEGGGPAAAAGKEDGEAAREGGGGGQKEAAEEGGVGEPAGPAGATRR
jgi:5'-nucleotidase